MILLAQHDEQRAYSALNSIKSQKMSLASRRFKYTIVVVIVVLIFHYFLPVTFDHFQILRAIGRGSFGKVCIVQKKGTDRLYAMKYMNKCQCRQRDALNNVLREVDILSRLEHPFLVNLWFSFQDEEDLFMVFDLFAGGDLRYHIQQKAQFSEDCVRLYILELGLALDYLQKHSVVHRDVKPDNILLDEQGHAHLTDLNIATVLGEGHLATSMSGTKPYIAPEIFACVAEECMGYNWAVDWWSLGVCAYEMLALFRPYDIHSNTSLSEVRSLFDDPLAYPSDWSDSIINLISKLLTVEPGGRITSLVELQAHPTMANFDTVEVLQKHVESPFIPPSDHLNCDPSLELEEMIVETKPLHKKKKRLAKQRSLQPSSIEMDKDTPDINVVSNFITYNREREIRRKDRERKELLWEEELLRTMEQSGESVESAGNSPMLSMHSYAKAPVRTRMRKSSSYSCTESVREEIEAEVEDTCRR